MNEATKRFIREFFLSAEGESEETIKFTEDEDGNYIVHILSIANGTQITILVFPPDWKPPVQRRRKK